MKRSVFVLLSVLALSSIAVAGGGGKPEDVFKGQIVVTKNRLPMRFSSPGAFVSALRSGRTDKVWPTEQRGNDHAEWNLEYVGFFAQPLNDNEVKVTFYDITAGKRMVATDAQYTRDRGSRVFGSNIKLAKPEFDVNKHYMMTMTARGKVVATTQFWLRGKGPNYSGKVEFSDSEAKAK